MWYRSELSYINTWILTPCRSLKVILGRESVTWCSEPSQPQRITLGLNTHFSFSPKYSFHKSLFHKFFCRCSNHNSNSVHNIGTQNQKTITQVLEPIYIPRTLNKGTYIEQGDLFHFVGPTQEPLLATSNTGKT